MPDCALKTQGFFQGQHRGPRQSWKEGQDWQAEGRMGLGRGVPHGARTSDLSQSLYLDSRLR